MADPLSLKIGFSVTYELDGQLPADTSQFRNALAQGSQPISAYVPELTALAAQSDQVFTGELTLQGNIALPYQSAIQQGGGGYTLDLAHASDAINVTGALLERVFWIPAAGPYIDGYFGFEFVSANVEVNGAWQEMQVIAPVGEESYPAPQASGFLASLPIIGSVFGDAPALPEFADPMAQIAVEQVRARLEASNLGLTPDVTAALATELVLPGTDGSEVGDGGGPHVGIHSTFLGDEIVQYLSGSGSAGSQASGALRTKGARDTPSSGGVARPGMCRGGGKHVGT